MIIDNLATTSVFEDLTLQELEDIALFCERKELYDGEVIIEENSNEDHDLFILIEGEVEVVSRDASCTSGEAVISEHEKNLFGEIAWLTNGRRTATVRAVGPAEIIRIEGSTLQDYIENNPRVGYCIMRRIATMLAKNLAETSTLLKQLLWNSNI